MPGMDGRAFLHWLQHTWVGRYPVPAIILCTANSLDNEMSALSLLIKQIVGKPFHARDLVPLLSGWETGMKEVHDAGQLRKPGA